MRKNERGLRYLVSSGKNPPRVAAPAGEQKRSVRVRGRALLWPPASLRVLKSSEALLCS